MCRYLGRKGWVLRVDVTSHQQSTFTEFTCVHVYIHHEVLLLILIFHVELSPKVVASAFWRGEVENELRRIGMVDYKFNLDSDYEKCMAVIDEMRREHTYPHPPNDCTEECRARG